jgi:hypothetical protein
MTRQAFHGLNLAVAFNEQVTEPADRERWRAPPRSFPYVLAASVAAWSIRRSAWSM